MLTKQKKKKTEKTKKSYADSREKYERSRFECDGRRSTGGGGGSNVLVRHYSPRVVSFVLTICAETEHLTRVFKIAFNYNTTMLYNHRNFD